MTRETSSHEGTHFLGVIVKETRTNQEPPIKQRNRTTCGTRSRDA